MVSLLLLIFAAVILAAFYYWYSQRASCKHERPNVRTIPQIVSLFPSTAAAIKQKTDDAIKQAQKCLEELYAVAPEKRTFSTIMYPLDLMVERFSIVRQAVYVLSATAPNDEVRKASHEACTVLGAFAIDNFFMNERLYKLCESYEKRLEDPQFEAQESLNEEQRFFVTETMRDFRRFGLQLPAEKRARVAEINKELSAFDTSFDQEIAAANKTLELSKDSLEGVSDAFLTSLKKNGDTYIVPVDMPHYDEIMQNCANAVTRKQMFRTYMQRGYPVNEKALKTIIRLRDELATLLGFKSYAHYDIAPAMAQNPETVETFLHSLVARAQAKCSVELEQLKKDLPASVQLTPTGQFQPWDLLYARNQYKKEHYALDESELANYFPIETTLPALLNVYEQFFGLSFKKVEASGLWHDDVEMHMVSKDNQYLGSIILDLYPRANKYTHAGVAAIVPSLKSADGTILPAVAVMVANFPAASDGRPALLKHRDVLIFFHEFGHALHCLLGATTYNRFASLEVKRDFVEMPSQMLESWMYDAEILKLISSHYQTKASLPDELIKKIQDLKTFGMGDHVLRQLVFAYMSLKCFLSGADKDIEKLWKEQHESIRDYILFDPENRGYCNFGHLVGYGAGYYGYLWSQVYALDLFSVIEKHGVLDKAIGERYTQEILAKGGSVEPAQMLRSFLGREPNSDAFFKDLGL